MAVGLVVGVAFIVYDSRDNTALLTITVLAVEARSVGAGVGRTGGQGDSGVAGALSVQVPVDVVAEGG